MNLRVMSLVLGVRSSSVAADPAGNAPGDRLTVEVSRQIPAEAAAGADSTRYLLAGAGHGRLARRRTQARQWTSVQVMTIIKDFLDGHVKS